VSVRCLRKEGSTRRLVLGYYPPPPPCPRGREGGLTARNCKLMMILQSVGSQGLLISSFSLTSASPSPHLSGKNLYSRLKSSPSQFLNRRNRHGAPVWLTPHYGSQYTETDTHIPSDLQYDWLLTVANLGNSIALLEYWVSRHRYRY
jgi:hypothetical protein